jgi:hypothetical protein
MTRWGVILCLFLVLPILAFYLCGQVVILCSELGFSLEKFWKASWSVRILMLTLVAALCIAEFFG